MAEAAPPQDRTPSAEALEVVRVVRASGSAYALFIDWRFNKALDSDQYEVFVRNDGEPIDDGNPVIAGRFSTKSEAVNETYRLRDQQIDAAYARALDAFAAQARAAAIAVARKYAIVKVERPAYGGGFVTHGFCCRECECAWGVTATQELHAEGCALARPTGDQP